MAGLSGDRLFFDKKNQERKASQHQDHQNVIDVVLADFKRVRLDAITLEADGFIQLLRGKLGRGHERNLLDALNPPRTLDNLKHQRLPYTLSALARADVNTPHVSLVAFFVIGTAEKAGRTGETAIGKTADHEVAAGIALRQSLPDGVNRGGLVLFG